MDGRLASTSVLLFIIWIGNAYALVSHSVGPSRSAETQHTWLHYQPHVTQSTHDFLAEMYF